MSNWNLNGLKTHAIIDLVSQGGERWNWGLNSSFKYVGMRKDMRDGAVLLTNRLNKVATLDQFLAQIGPHGTCAKVDVPSNPEIADYMIDHAIKYQENKAERAVVLSAMIEKAYHLSARLISELEPGTIVIFAGQRYWLMKIEDGKACFLNLEHNTHTNVDVSETSKPPMLLMLSGIDTATDREVKIAGIMKERIEGLIEFMQTSEGKDRSPLFDVRQRPSDIVDGIERPYEELKALSLDKLGLRLTGEQSNAHLE